MPTKDKSGIDVYDNSNYTAPVHVIVGAGGFSLDSFPNNVRVMVTINQACMLKAGTA